MCLVEVKVDEGGSPGFCLLEMLIIHLCFGHSFIVFEVDVVDSGGPIVGIFEKLFDM